MKFQVGDKVRDISETYRYANITGEVTHVNEKYRNIRVRMTASNNGDHRDYDSDEYWIEDDFELVSRGGVAASVVEQLQNPAASPFEALVSQARARIVVLEEMLESRVALETELRALKRMVAAAETDETTGAV